MNTAKTWLKKAIVFLVVAAMAIALFPFTGLRTVTKAAEGSTSFGLKWEEDEAEKTAIVYFGVTEDGSFSPFTNEPDPVFDTTAGSISLANTFDGYVYSHTYYQLGDTSVLMRPILYKVSEGNNYKWQADMTIFDEEGHSSVQRRDIEPDAIINVEYLKKSEVNPNPPPSEDVDGPETVKKVEATKDADGKTDGTYTITLDITGKVKHEETKVGANVLIVLDRTRSMRYGMNSSSEAAEADNRWTAAKDAIDTLITILSTGDNAKNDMQYALMTFYRVVDGQEDGDVTGQGTDLPESPLYYTWGDNNSPWTSDAAAFNAFIQNTEGEHVKQPILMGTAGNAYNGTNWEDPLYRANALVNSSLTDKDKTYVIFVTDGEPNASGTGEAGSAYTGYSAAGGPAAVSAATIRATTLYGNSKAVLYGVFCSEDDDAYDTLDGMLTAAATAAGLETRPATIYGSDSETMKTEFGEIAKTIVNDLGSTNTVADDGIPSLSSVSANVAGEAGGFEYYLSGGKKEDGTEKYNHEANGGLGETWTNPAGASYSNDNGVTWDLSSVGVLEEGVTYRLRFKVWPSQAAFDLIANLNNKTQKINDSSITDDIRAQLLITINGTQYKYDGTSKTWTNGLSSDDLQELIESASSVVYQIPTNTHLNTTFTYNGKTYTDIPDELPSEAMLLESEEMDVIKDWDDEINPRNRADKVDFYLYELRKEDGEQVKYYYQKDGTFKNDTENAYVLTVDKDGGWKASIQIALGFATKSGDTITVMEPGHKFALEEKGAYKQNKNTGEWEEISGYSMEFTTETVRPMEVNGVPTYFVLIDSDNPLPDGATEVEIDGEKYYDKLQDPDASNNSSITGTNHKSSELDITKKIDEENSVTDKTSDELSEEEFTYTVTLTAPVGSDTSGVKFWRYRGLTDEDTKAGESGYTLPEYGKDAAAYAPKDYSDTKKFIGDDVGAGLDEGKLISFTDNTATVEVTMNRTEVIRFTNLPTGTKYTIVESAANGKPIAEQGYTVSSIGSTTKEPDTSVTATIKGEINEYAKRYYNQFVNVIKAVDAELKVTKAMNYDLAEGDESYEFTLTAVDGAPLPYKNAKDGNKVTISSSGNLTDTFGVIRFTEAKTYQYTITETNGGNEDLLYGGPETVTVTVEEVEEELEDGTTVKKLVVSNIEGEHTEFDNTTTPASADTTITNSLILENVTIVKVFTGITKEQIPTTFLVTATCGSETKKLTIKDTDVKVSEDGLTYTWVVNNIKAGTKVSVAEEGTKVSGYTETQTLPDAITVTHGGDNKLTITNAYTIKTDTATVHDEITITKIDQDEKPLTGAEFTLLSGSTTVATFQGGEFKINTGDTALANYLPEAGKTTTFTLKETKAPAGYKLNSTEYTISIGAEESTDLVEDVYVTTTTYIMTVGTEEKQTIINTKKVRVDDVHDSIEITKVDMDGEEIAGATFTLTDGENKEVDTYTGGTFTISTEDEALANYLPDAGKSVTLTLQETEAPDGYEKDDTKYEVVISAAASEETLDEESDVFVTTITYTMTIDKAESKEVPNPKITKNERVDGEITINKVDQSGKKLDGATFSLTDGETEVATFTGGSFTIKTDNAKLASVLPAVGGTKTLTLKETEAPKNYKLDETEYSVVISASSKEELKDHAFVTTTTYTITVDDKESVDVVNTELTEATVKKVWVDEGNLYGIRPGQLKVTLLADGEEVETIELKASQSGSGWEATVTDLLVYNEDDEPIEYTWEEELPKGYKLVSNVTEGTITTITNKAITVSVDPPVQKIIKGNDDLYNKGDFTFKIENVSAPKDALKVPMPKNTSITNSPQYELEGKQGYYEFGPIVFAVPGEYEYKVTESGSVKGVTNDPEAETGKTIKFTVTENEDGSLTIDPTTEKVELSFTNTYKEEPKTGDSNNMTLWMIIMALAAISGASGIIFFKKSRKDN